MRLAAARLDTHALHSSPLKAPSPPKKSPSGRRHTTVGVPLQGSVSPDHTAPDVSHDVVMRRLLMQGLELQYLRKVCSHTSLD